MKRVFSLILVVFTICILAGCHYSNSGDILEPVEFFYPRKTTGFVYGAENGVIASEIREASGHIDDLTYLLTMYLRGPQDAALYSPFPEGCGLKDVFAKEDTLYIRLSAEFTALENTDLTIACIALTKTCLAMTDYPYICINAETDAKTIHMILGDESVLFADRSVFEMTNETKPPQ